MYSFLFAFIFDEFIFSAFDLQQKQGLASRYISYCYSVKAFDWFILLLTHIIDAIEVIFEKQNKQSS